MGSFIPYGLVRGETLREYIDESVREYFHFFHLYLMHLNNPCVPLFFYLPFDSNRLWVYDLECEAAFDEEGSLFR